MGHTYISLHKLLVLKTRIVKIHRKCFNDTSLSKRYINKLHQVEKNDDSLVSRAAWAQAMVQ